jgi:hypothetical protein
MSGSFIGLNRLQRRGCWSAKVCGEKSIAAGVEGAKTARFVFVKPHDIWKKQQGLVLLVVGVHIITVVCAAEALGVWPEVTGGQTLELDLNLCRVKNVDRWS